MLNKVILMGRLTAAPELRHTQAGIPVCTFTLAVQGEHTKEGTLPTDFIDIVAWRGTAEFVSKWFDRGQLVVICGRLGVRTWNTRDGERRRNYEVSAQQCYFAEKRNGVGESDLLTEVDRGADGYEQFAQTDGELPF